MVTQDGDGGNHNGGSPAAGGESEALEAMAAAAHAEAVAATPCDLFPVTVIAPLKVAPTPSSDACLQ